MGERAVREVIEDLGEMVVSVDSVNWVVASLDLAVKEDREDREDMVAVVVVAAVVLPFYSMAKDKRSLPVINSL